MDSVDNRVFMNDSRDDELTSASNRHQLEDNKNLNRSDKIIDYTLEIPEVNTLCRDYILWIIDSDQFKVNFNMMVEGDANIQDALNSWSIKYMSSNILDVLDTEKGKVSLLNNIINNVDNIDNIDTNTFISSIQAAVSKWDIDPVFADQIISHINTNEIWQLKLLLQQQKFILDKKLSNLNIKLWVLAKTKSAYSIDNKDREKSSLYKIWHRLDKINWRVKALWFAGISVWAWLLWWPLWLWAVWSSILATWVSSTLVGWMNLFKKWSHYTKEQNTHEKNITTDFDDTIDKIRQWQDDAASRWVRNWFKRYKARRQLKLYNDTTQGNIALIEDLSNNISDILSDPNPLDDHQEDLLKLLLIEAKSRLMVYYDTWHNFLASKTRWENEQDMNKLHQLIDRWVSKIWIIRDDVDTLTTTSWYNVQNISDMLLHDYDRVTKIFFSERTKLSWKYWISSAIVSAWTSIGIQNWLGTWIFSKGPSAITGPTTSATDSFALWSHVSSYHHVYSTTKSIFASAPSWSHINIDYGAGTDLTAIRAGSSLNLYSTYTGKLSSAVSYIHGLSWLSPSQKFTLLSELSLRKRESLRSSSWFTNDYLHGERAIETITEVARSLNDSWNTSTVISLNYDNTLDVIGSTIHNTLERSWSILMSVTSSTPGSGGTAYISVPLFANTFTDDSRDRNDEDNVSEGDNSNRENS